MTLAWFTKILIVAAALLGVALGSAHAFGAPAAGAPAVRLRRFALVVGVNDGGPTRARLRYAVTDARSMARVLQNLGGVAASDLVIVADPNRAALEAGFTEVERLLRASEQPGVRRELLVYYSGHSDEEGLMLGRDRVTYDELRARIHAAPVELRVAILDSCASGAFTRRKGGTRRAPFLMDSSIDMRGHAYLTSSAADEVAQESDRIAASFFTHFLVSGLRGAADANADRRVTLQEAFQFASQETLARTERTQGGPQHAAYDFDLRGTGDMVVTDVRTTQAGLVLTPELSGRISVREAGGALVAELRKPAGNTIELGVEAGSYLVAIDAGGTAFEAQVTLVSGQRAELARAAFHAGPAREVAMARGDGPPAAAAAEPAAVAASAPAPQHERLSVKAGFVPRAADARTDVEGMSFGFIADRVARLRGAQLSIGYNQVDGAMVGGQVAAGANAVRGGMKGFQLSSGANIAAGSSRGLQLVGAANVSDGDFRGVQLAGGIDVVTGTLQGLQLAGGAALARSGRGLQLAGGAAVADGFTGVQVAPINYVRKGEGVQVGAINVAGQVTGFRLAAINVARETRGFQLGVINVATRDEGESFAIINLIGNGIHELSLYGSDVLLSNFALKLGGRHMYTALSIGYEPGDGLVGAGPERLTRASRRWGTGGAIGWRFPLQTERAYLEVEAGATEVKHEISDGTPAALVSSLRAQVGVRVLPLVALVAGVGANVSVATSGRDADLALMPERVVRDGTTTVRIYPGFVLGLQI